MKTTIRLIAMYVIMALGMYASAYATEEATTVPVPVPVTAPVAVPIPDAAPAATPPPAQIKAEAPVNAPKLWLDTPYFKGYVPLNQVSVISLFDFVNKRPLVGAETVLCSIKRIVFTGGGVTSIQGTGSPYVGGYLVIPNPAPSLVFLNDLELGGWGGRDFREGRYMAGLKIGKQIW